MDELFSVDDVFDKLGGIAGVARLTGRSYNATWNWKAIGTFPPSAYVVMTDALASLGYTAPPALWRMIPKQPTP